MSTKLQVMDPRYRASAERVRSLLSRGAVSPAGFRSALTEVPPSDRDAWVDIVFGFSELPDDGPGLPSGCVPYLPCPVDALLRVVEHADVQATDVFVDVGSGLGRAAAVVHSLTGAAAIGLEIQPQLLNASREVTTRLNLSRLKLVHGDAADLTGRLMIGSVFFLYCPFSGARLEQVLADLEPIARTRTIRVCCVDLPLPSCSWLTLAAPAWADLAIYRSTLLDPVASAVS
jgi:SAM-dependent methyltransferase